MELNSTSIHIGDITFCGNGSNLSDPSVTILVARLPHLNPSKAKLLSETLKPLIVNIVKLIEAEQKGTDDD